MQVVLTEEQAKILENLVDSRIREIHPEIRRSRFYDVHEDLKCDLEMLQGLLDLLRSQRYQQAGVAPQEHVEGRDI